MRFRDALTAVANRLAERDYSGLARDGFVSYTNDPNDESIGMWIDSYPATLGPLPIDTWQCADAVETGEPGRWSVVVPLLTREEGRSDLSIWRDSDGARRRATCADRRRSRPVVHASSTGATTSTTSIRCCLRWTGALLASCSAVPAARFGVSSRDTATTPPPRKAAFPGGGGTTST